MELIGLHLETVTLPDEVIRVEVHVVTVGRLGERQGQLFSDRWPTDPHQLAILINRLASRLGHEQVTRAELRQPCTGTRGAVGAAVQREGEKGKRGRRSGNRSSLESPTLPLSVSPPLALSPTAPDRSRLRRPRRAAASVWLDRRRERIVHHAGPERIETLWWRGPSIRRDYYRVTTDGGHQLWLFRRLADAKWFLHGHLCLEGLRTDAGDRDESW